MKLAELEWMRLPQERQAYSRDGSQFNFLSSVFVGLSSVFPPVPRGRRTELTLERAIESRLRFVSYFGCYLRDAA